MKEIAEEVKTKDEKIREKLNEYTKIQKEPGRSHYTDRILDFVKSVKKQKAEIDKVFFSLSIHFYVDSPRNSFSSQGNKFYFRYSQ